MTKVAVMQPYLFPYIGYFQLINAVDTFVCFDDVHFIKKGWINRNNILWNNEPKLFTFPLTKVSQNKLINQHDFADFNATKQEFITLIQQSYDKAPQYESVVKLIDRIFDINSINISDFIVHSLKEICSYLKISTQIVNSSEIKKDMSLPAQERIINIVQECDGDHYINAIGGKVLYERTAFLNKGIKLSFIETHAIRYRQFGDAFTPHLTIIDLLMFNTKDSISQLLKQYELVSK